MYKHIVVIKEFLLCPAREMCVFHLVEVDYFVCILAFY